MICAAGNCVCALNKWCYLAGFTKLIQISLTGTRWRYAIVMVHPLLVTQKVRLGLVYLYNFETLGFYLSLFGIACWWLCVLHIKIQMRNSFLLHLGLFDASFFFLPKTLIIYSRKEVGCSSEVRSYGKLLWMNSYQLACRKQNRLYFYCNPKYPIFLVFLLLLVLLIILLLKIHKIISGCQFPILPLALSYLKIKMISRWCILESHNMSLIFL